MADDLADFPIVVLEADYPEQVGKVGLFDYLMPVGATGIVFTAAVPGLLREWGPVFSDAVQKAANLRAASTLVQWGLVRGDTFAFLRQALRMTQADVAAIDGVLLATVQGWEDGTIPLPRTAWSCLAFRVSLQDGRSGLDEYATPYPDFRPRLIRVFPNIPMQPMPQQPSTPCPPMPPTCGVIPPSLDPLC